MTRFLRCVVLSKRQRRLTPLPFARFLVELVKAEWGCERVAVLWCCPKSLYNHLWPEVQIWDRRADARRYAGPFPIIAHPPCGPWGKFKRQSKEGKEHGIIAMEFVHKWGGVVEHPLGSSLFRDFGRGGRIVKLNQGDYGHPALKPTILYVVDRQLREELEKSALKPE